MFENLFSQNVKTSHFGRRDILKMGFAAFAAASLPIITMRKAEAAISSAAAKGGAWSVRFQHAHTGEMYSGTYRVGDKYLPNAFQGLNHFLRDFRTGEIFPMDPHVLDIVSLIQTKTKSHAPLQILSGYRCPATNALLNETTPGVAKNSFHMYGQAIDIRLEGFKTSKLRDIAKSLHAGGVGYYPNTDFVHVDTGSVRYW